MRSPRKRRARCEYEELRKRVVEAYKALEQRCDFVVCEGTDFGGAAALAFGRNADLANELGAPVLVVVRGGTPEETLASVRAARGSLDHKDCAIFGVVVNRVDPENVADVAARLAGTDGEEPVYVLPERPELAYPTVAEIAAQLDATILFDPREALHREVRDVRVAAMSVEHFIDNLVDGALVIVPGDRPDILVTAFASTISAAIPTVSGVVLTGGYPPSEPVRRLLESAPFPVLEATQLTHEVAAAVQSVQPVIGPEDERKVATALGLFEASVDTGELERRIALDRPARVTPIMFEYELMERAKARRTHIVLPEGEDERVLRAAEILLRRDVVDLTILGGVEDVRGRAAALGLDLDRAALVDPARLAAAAGLREPLLRAAQAQGGDRRAGVRRGRRSELLRHADGAGGRGRRHGVRRRAHDRRHGAAGVRGHQGARGRLRGLERVLHVPRRSSAGVRRLRRQPQAGHRAARRHRDQLGRDRGRVRHRAADRDALLLHRRIGPRRGRRRRSRRDGRWSGNAGPTSRSRARSSTTPPWTRASRS